MDGRNRIRELFKKMKRGWSIRWHPTVPGLGMAWDVADSVSAGAWREGSPGAVGQEAGGGVLVPGYLGKGGEGVGVSL